MSLLAQSGCVTGRFIICSVYTSSEGLNSLIDCPVEETLLGFHFTFINYSNYIFLFLIFFLSIFILVFNNRFLGGGGYTSLHAWEKEGGFKLTAAL